MSRTHTLFVLFAATTLSACTAPEAELDALEQNVSDALVLGDHAAALELGSLFLGQQIDPDEVTPFAGAVIHGYVAGLYAPAGGNGSPAVEVGGRLITDDLTTRHQMRGAWITPTGDQVRGQMYARTRMEEDTLAGMIAADFQAAPTGDQGTLRGGWRAEDGSASAFIRATYVDDATNEGRFFGTFASRAIPAWGDSVRVRIEVDGVSEVMVNPAMLVIHHASGAAPGLAGTADQATGTESRPVIINGERWKPTFPAEGEAIDCDCDSSPFYAPSGELLPQSADASVLTLSGRGPVTLTSVPSADNSWTVAVQFDDSAYEGAAWYEFELVYPDAN